MANFHKRINEKVVGNVTKRYLANFFTVGVGDEFPFSVADFMQKKYQNGNQDITDCFFVSS